MVNSHPHKFVLIAMRVHLFPSRTQKLSSFAPTILGGRLPGKIGNANTCPTAYAVGLFPFMEKPFCRSDFMISITPSMLVDQGICPTCYDRTHDCCLYGDPTERILYENERFTCLLITNPRCPGHTIISSKQHYKDMLDLPPELCSEIYIFAQRVMLALKRVYTAESVYLCTMCDGPMNHFHVQLIPRFNHELRGSGNFVKPRTSYEHEPEKIAALRELLQS